MDGFPFTEVWLVDFEFRAPDGERPDPHTLVAREWRSGKLVRLCGKQLRQLSKPPYRTDKDALFVAYYASAELGCHLALGWPMPEYVLDLFVEFRWLTNGLPVPSGNGLLGALTYFGLDGIGAAEKEGMRQLAMRGGPFNAEEREALLDYCQEDVDALGRLLPVILPLVDLPRALLRGRYMAAVARMEWNGVPVDIKTLQNIRLHATGIQQALIKSINRDYGVFDGTTFKADLWEVWLVDNGIPWPRLPSGRLALDDDTFRQMGRAFPQVEPVRELRTILSKLRLESLAVGSDARNRCLLSPYRARTGRNQPSNSRFIFGPARYIRGLIKPPPNYGLAYIDWCQQEVGIAAALSGDERMMGAYASGDPYLEFGKQAGAIPADGTKETHGSLRNQFKACVLAVQYGMGAESLAYRVGQPTARARQLLDTHHRTYRTFWEWSDQEVDRAFLHGQLDTVLGWRIRVGPDANGRSVRNFPMQANGAEMLRVACIATTEAGIRVCAPVHDAILIEAPLEDLDHAVAETQRLMQRASSTILDGFELRSDVHLVRYPDRYMDEAGAEMWERVMEILGRLERADEMVQT
jgi:DNA polymerase I